MVVTVSSVHLYDMAAVRREGYFQLAGTLPTVLSVCMYVYFCGWWGGAVFFGGTVFVLPLMLCSLLSWVVLHLTNGIARS